MDLSSLLNKKQESTLIDQGFDPVKYEAIKTKLCTKRKLLEETLKQATLSNTERADHLSSLSLLTGSMATFGISEIDYQAFLATTKTSDEDQLSLF